MISESVEDYLKSIYLVACDESRVTTQALARRLDVAAPSVTGMIKKLSRMRLVHYEPYHGVTLTPAGEKVALEVVRHHRLLEQYLAKALGYSWDKVHAEADKLEHHISEEFEDRIAAWLGNPQTDPHGDPIPAKDGKIHQLAPMRLTDAVAGETVVVTRVANQDTALLTYLDGIGIRPEVQVRVAGLGPFNGPVHVRVGRKEHHLGREAAGKIFVKSVKRNTKQ